MEGRLNVDFKSRLKLDLFLRSYIYSERGKFAASFYNKNSILVFFRNGRFLEGGLKVFVNELNIILTQITCYHVAVMT